MKDCDHMEEKVVNIKLNDIDKIIKDNNGIVDTNTYVINLDNCNGITMNLLNELDKSKIDFKFKIYNDFNNTDTFGKTPLYNYDLSQMKEIISIFEEIKNATSNLNKLGRFFFTYRLLSELFKYNDYYSGVEEDLTKVEGIKRSIYGSLINGEGVCVGFAVTLSNILNYLGINSKTIHGIGTTNTGLSGGHAWNAVELNDKWYETDLTFDLIDNINLPFCLKVDEDFISTHEPYDVSEIKDLDYSSDNFDSDLKYNYNYVIYNNEELRFKDVLEKVKSYMKKKKTKTIEEMSIRELMTNLYGKEKVDELINESHKSL